MASKLHSRAKAISIQTTSFTNNIDKPVTNDGTRILFKGFRVLGIRMPEKYKFLYIIYSLIVNILSLILLPLTFSISFFTDPENLELAHLFTSFPLALNLHACALKFVMLAFLRRHLFKIEAILEKLDARISSEEEETEIRWAIKFGNRTMISFFAWFSSFTVLAFAGSVYNGRPVYSLYIPFLDWRESQLNLVIFIVLEFFLLNVALIQNVVNDGYALIYIRMLHSHFNTLKIRVSRIGGDPEYSQGDNLKELRLCIKDHKNLIELINSIAPVISPTMFVQFMVSATVMGSALISIAMSHDRATIVGSWLVICIVVTEILPTCYFVNRFMPEGDRLAETIFHMNWMDQSLEFRRLCLFFMHRSQKVMTLYAGKIFPITINTFFGIVKFSFSLYTLLSTMDFGERFN